MLWRKMMCLQPPDNLLTMLQRNMIDFWNGKHWLEPAMTYLPLSKGGHGLIDIRSRIICFRLYFVSQLLYGDEALLWKLLHTAYYRLQADLYIPENSL